jgi:hypothetical protein
MEATAMVYVGEVTAGAPEMASATPRNDLFPLVGGVNDNANEPPASVSTRPKVDHWPDLSSCKDTADPAGELASVPTKVVSAPACG